MDLLLKNLCGIAMIFSAVVVGWRVGKTRVVEFETGALAFSYVVMVLTVSYLFNWRPIPIALYLTISAGLGPMPVS